ncbi:ATP-dependent DNA helicase Rep [Gilliamella sp. App2-1]|uniref:DNA helicase Rep n=1 Tax=Gilliamella sp. App2-1 TaxID=3120230 RepID=UPI0008290932|nr:DNA helicase Rep [Gilliamella apicola]OCG22082.1 ATP-dependent DNA helicase Rep [Gilliamella apicola]
MRLNSSQQKAVEYVSGPCLVLAGAGSGKTRVIINKIAYLIRVKEYLPRHIVAVTFTNKAAREMKERIAQSLSKQEARGLKISTFHTLGLDIVRREYRHLGIKSNFSLFDDHDQTALLKELTYQWLEGDKDLINQLRSTISNWKNDIVDSTIAMASAQTNKEKLFAHCYQLYEKQLKACSILDFDDLILLPTLLLKNNEEVREKWQNRVRYLLVDEYQDTNTSQYEFIKLLVGNRAKFTVVGDDDQSIYSWRGARPQNLVLLKQDFPTLEVIKLEQNYRSSGRILKVANILIENNPHIFEKKLFSELGYGETLKVISADSEEHEAEKVINDLIGHRFAHNGQYGQYAILYRGNHQARLIEKILMQYRIPYRISGGTSFFARIEIKDLMAYLRLLTNPDDDNAFIRIINTPKREIGPATIQKLGEWANHRGVSLYQASHDMGLTQLLSGKRMESLQVFIHWFDTLIQKSHHEPMDVIYELLHGINYESWIYETSSSPAAGQMRMRNVEQLISWLNGMLQGYDIDEAMTLEQAVARFTLRDMLERNEAEEELDQVQLMTLHASKGLEFPYVYLVGMSEGLLPHQNSIDEDNIEEERRLAYVGITRAQQELTFSFSRQRKQFGETLQVEPSRFLLELPQDDLVWQDQRNELSPEKKMQQGQSRIAMLKAQIDKAK